MKAEIIAVGTEILLGQIVNTNAQYLSEGLAQLGIDVYFQTVVGDNKQRIYDVLKTAHQRADLIICCGGLGPTQDDLTKDIFADFVGKPMYVHEPSMEKMVQLFQQRGIEMTDNNIKQAHIVPDCEPLKNDTGLAVGLALTHNQHHYILLPGPPRELKPMFERYAVPWLKSLIGEKLPLYSKYLKFAGIGESILEDRLKDLMEQQKDPSIAPYAKEGEVLIRLTTKAESEQKAYEKMQSVEQEIMNRVGKYLYASENISFEQALISKLESLGLSLSVAESCTGGKLSELLTSVPGSSLVYKGGIICYSNQLKNKVLHVPMEVLEGEGAPGAISSESAALLAENLNQLTDTDWSISITGVAGPTISEGKPVGLIYIGIKQKGRPAEVKKIQLPGSREMVQLRSAKYALYQLWKKIREI
ncbi:competence/damage-inducible protein A [Chengkuizengella axinellae]|uniref:Putative competence-damage inducible protein n=1 Tax=Chengkuizengella axinellae TaxID=3064388 RepID=A0ABT9IW01_9BACL|nr:competence/damage-inducible protein A [Chengkuizengella sp. 2205SS18-9]MDP5273513.1 competence/damage-inducible protein A [Chengkuizengella sp. 2205SS18-9]